MNRKRAVVFVSLCVVGMAVTSVYLLHVKRRLAHTDALAAGESTAIVQAPAPVAEPPAPEAAVPGQTTPAQPAGAPAPVASGEGPPQAAPSSETRRLFYRHTGVDGHYGQVAWLDLAHRTAIHYVDSLRCEVVYVAGGHGICLSADRGVFTTYAASLFDARDFKVSASFELKGIPSRARVSIDGSLAALTVFVSGHGYTTLDFSTQTLLIEVASGKTVADLEEFEVRRDGAVIKSADFNFWGVTFTPDAREFYATLSTAGSHFLVRGDIAARTATIIHENVECPSLSPDARHVAYKKRFNVEGRIGWQLHALELATGREIALSEKRSIDDQLEWLDDRQVLYSVPSAADGSSPSTDVWSANIDARSPPRLFLRSAYSPAAARCKTAAACAAAVR